jgi:uncharacterized YigZ family protein
VLRLTYYTIILPSFSGELRISSHTSLQGPEHYAALEVKKSRFLTWAWPVASPDEALAHIDARRDPSASHNCFAYKIGDVYRSSDDGEPGGTAGRPILSAIESEGLDHVCVLVVRHFGGIKLGTGGLVRAYGAAAREVLRAAPRVDITVRVTVTIKIPYDLVGAAYAVVAAQGVQRLEESYEGGEGVVLTVAVEESRVSQLEAALRDGTSGKVGIEIAP